MSAREKAVIRAIQGGKRWSTICTAKKPNTSSRGRGCKCEKTTHKTSNGRSKMRAWLKTGLFSATTSTEVSLPVAILAFFFGRFFRITGEETD